MYSHGGWGTLVPIKYYFICYCPVGFINGSPVGCKSQLIWIFICKSCSTGVSQTPSREIQVRACTIGRLTLLYMQTDPFQGKTGRWVFLSIPSLLSREEAILKVTSPRSRNRYPSAKSMSCVPAHVLALALPPVLRVGTPRPLFHCCGQLSNREAWDSMYDL